MNVLAELVANIVGPDGASPFAVGVVQATAPLTVTWRGADIPAASTLASYTPAIGHTVLMARHGSQLIVLGQLA